MAQPEGHTRSVLPIPEPDVPPPVCFAMMPLWNVFGNPDQPQPSVSWRILTSVDLRTHTDRVRLGRRILVSEIKLQSINNLGSRLCQPRTSGNGEIRVAPPSRSPGFSASPTRTPLAPHCDSAGCGHVTVRRTEIRQANGLNRLLAPRVRRALPTLATPNRIN